MNRRRFALTAALAVSLPCAFVAFASVASADPPQTENPAIDPAALALLKKAETAMFALKTYQAEWEETQINQHSHSKKQVDFIKTSLIAAKPNKMRSQGWRRDDVSDDEITTGKMTKWLAERPDFVRVCSGTT